PNTVCRRDPAGGAVIGQDLRQGGLVGGLDEALDRAGGQFGEGGVGRGEDGEGARARQGFRQPGGGHRGDERGVSGGGGGGVDDGRVSHRGGGSRRGGGLGVRRRRRGLGGRAGAGEDCAAGDAGGEQDAIGNEGHRSSPERPSL